MTIGDSFDDQDADGLPDDWERQFGLDATSADGANGADGDPDGDGATNYVERLNGTHPRGFFRRHLAEGAGRPLFETRLALVKPRGTQPARALITFLNDDGSNVHLPLEIPGERRVTVDCTSIAGVTQHAFSILVESDNEVVVTRTMSWGGEHGGSHMETAASAPRERWYFAEGATHSGFQLFYLVQNPGETTVDVTATFLRPAPLAPARLDLRLQPRSRTTVWANHDLGIAPSDLSAEFRASSPVVIERAMYRTDPTTGLFTAGHVSLGAPAPTSEWFFAEGATGPIFDAFLLLANFSPAPGLAEVWFLLPGGEIVEKHYEVLPHSRRTIAVESEDPRLAHTAFSMRVAAASGDLVAERAMWWSGAWNQWYEGHTAAAASAPAVSWAMAEGEAGTVGDADSYILIANPSLTEAHARVTLLPEATGDPESLEFVVAPGARLTVSAYEQFPAFRGRRFGARVDSLGTPAVPVVVEEAVYRSGARWWSKGGAAPAADVTPILMPLADIVAEPDGDVVEIDIVQRLPPVAGTTFSVEVDEPSRVVADIDPHTGGLRLLPVAGAMGQAVVRVVALTPWGEAEDEAFSIRVGPAPVSFDAPYVVNWSVFPSVADTDNDGDIDVLGGRNEGGTLFYVDLNGVDPLVRRDARLADVNGDHLPDVVSNVYLPITDSAGPRLFINRGDHTFVEDPDFFALAARGYGHTIVAADFDNDGDVDLFLPNYSHHLPTEQSYLLINDGTGKFTERADAAGVSLRGLPVDVRTEGAQALDFNGDGWLDLYVASHLFINNGDLTFTDRRAELGLPVLFDEGMKFLDWNNDGHLDLAVHHPHLGPQLYEYDGSTFSHRPDVIPAHAYDNSYGFNVYDLNNDGREDMITSGGLGHSTAVLINTGRSFVPNDPTYIDAWGQDCLAFGDFDGDGLADVVKRLDGVLVHARNTTAVDPTRTLRIDVVDAHGRHNQFGRVVRIRPAAAPETIMTRVVDGGSGFMAQNQYELLVGTLHEGAHEVTVGFADGPVTFTMMPGERVRVSRTGTVVRR